MKLKLIALLAFSLSVVSFAAQRDYPLGPDKSLTPGVFCERPNSYRYPEKIAYCERNVDTSEKMEVIQDYNDKLGYNITRKERPQFKIDHLIPLCAGGSNDKKNLWPQHETVYTKTDPIEAIACQRMSEGKLTQKQAVELIFTAKNDLSKAEAVFEQLQRMK